MTCSKSNKWKILFVVNLVSFITNVDSTIVTLGLPKIMEGLNITLITGLFTITSYIIANTVLLLPGGRWGDMIGTKRIFILGCTIFTIGTALCGVANSGTLLIIFRFIQGTGAALASATATPIIVKTFSKDELGFALGINSTSWVVGALVGPVAGGALISTFGWRSIFYSTIPFAIIGIIGAILFVKDDDISVKSKTDWIGILTFGLGLAGIMTALSEGEAWGWSSRAIVGLFICTVILGIVFTITELHIENPLFNFKLFWHRDYTIGLGITLNYVVAYFCITLFLTIYLQGALHLSPMESSLLLIPLSAPQLILGPLGGKLADSFGQRKMIVLGIQFLGIGLFMLGNLGAELSIANIIIPLIILCIGNGIAWPALAKTILSAVKKEEAGAAAGIFYTINEFGRALSQTLAVLILGISVPTDTISKAIVGAADLNNLQIKDDLIYSINLGFRFFTIFFVIALILSFFLHTVKREGKVDREIKNHA